MAEKKKLTAAQKWIAILTLVGLTCYSCISIGLAASAYGNLNSNVDELTDIITNWQTPTILDIQVKSACDPGYQSALLDRSWGGVSDGCWCGNGDQTKMAKYNITCSPFCSGSCSSDAITSGCNTVNGRAQQVLNIYGKDTTLAANLQNLQLCVKRSAETWVDNGLISAGKCPSGYTSCGSGDNQFCTREQKCPINQITITTGATVATLTGCPSATCAILTRDVPNNIYKKVEWKTATNNVDALPLSQLTLNQFSMCRLEGTDNISPGRKSFYLYNGQTTSCGYEGSTRWAESDTVLESNLFSYNGLSTYISGLSTYTASGMAGYYPTGMDGTKYKWGIYSRGYIPFKTSCREKLKPLIAKKDFVDGVRSAQLALLIISIVSVVLLGVPLAVMEIQNLRGVDLTCIEGKGEEERTKLKKIKKTIGYIFKGVQLPFQIWAIIYSAGARGLLLDVADDYCSNLETNAVLIFIAQTLNKTYTSTITAIAILVASLLVDIALDWWERRKAKKEAANGKAISPAREENIQLAAIDNSESSSPLKFGGPVSTNRTATQTQPSQPIPQPQPQAQPQAQAQQGPNIVIQIQPGQMGAPQQQYPPQQYPPQQYPPQQGYPQQQYPPQQYPPQQGYPQQGYPQQQYPPQQYPPQQGYPQQQYPPRY